MRPAGTETSLAELARSARVAGARPRTADPALAARLALRGRRTGWIGNTFFGGALLLCALSLPMLAAAVAGTLAVNARLSLHQFGFRFLTQTAWNPVAQRFGVVTFLLGTLLSSLLALLLAAPAALAMAVFLNEICPHRWRGTLVYLTELLAAIPSVVYGLWALLVLVPAMRSVIAPALMRWLGWTGLFGGPSYGVGVLTASLILAVMIFPVISSVSREVMRAVPAEQREAVLALGATRWEMIRLGVLRNARLGLSGALILGLGRALGETMAVAMVIGSHPALFRSLLAPGYTMASVIANEFAEASGDLHLSALMEMGLVLLLVTGVVNAVARVLVWLVERPLGRLASSLEPSLPVSAA